MPQHVVDLSSNAPENIANAAKAVGRGRDRRRVFDAIYRGKRLVKTAAQIALSTGLSEKRVLEEAKFLSDNHVINKTKVGGRMAYEKIDFYHRNKRQILALSESKKKLAAFPTKRNPAASNTSTQRIKVELRVPRRGGAKHVKIDDIENFTAIRKIGASKYDPIPEARFKDGIAKILGEQGSFKDWGGENRDLSSTRVRIGGKRKAAAFAFKGPGKKGKLTPGKMGKNGDQIQRLVRCPAEAFFVQYWAEIDDSVLEQLKDLVTLKAYLNGEQLLYGIIDGNDSARLMAAYPKQFVRNKKGTRR